MATVGLCAGYLALLVQAPIIAVLFGPLIPSALEVSKGGNGLKGGIIGGVMTWVGVSIFIGLCDYNGQPASGPTPSPIVPFLMAFAKCTAVGALIGLVEGTAFLLVRFLFRQRAERSARANLYGSNPRLSVVQAPDLARRWLGNTPD